MTKIQHNSVQPVSRNDTSHIHLFITKFRQLGWTFLIWNVIFAWQAAWLIYSITLIFRKSKTNYLYIEPNTLHFSVYALYILNMALHLSWDFLWDREYLGVSETILSGAQQSVDSLFFISGLCSSSS